MTDQMKLRVEEKAKEIYKAGLTDSEDFFTSFDGLDNDQMDRFIRVAKHALSCEIKARIEVYQCLFPDILLPAKDASKNRINELTSELRELEGEV